MTDNEIIKSLECCIIDDCDSCPHYPIRNCNSRLKLNALDLINRQKAEIDRLQTRIGELIRQYNNDIEKTKNEAIKEFAERLKEKSIHCPLYDNRALSRGESTSPVHIKVVPNIDIDNLVKEMVGEA